MKANYPRVVLEAVTQQERVKFRVVADRREDANGILQDVKIVETWDGSVDALGVPRWERLGDKSGWATWQLVALAAIDLLLQENDRAENL